MKIALITAFTLVAFAANSLLCRMALGGALIDPVSFTTIRLASGALALILISRWFAEKKSERVAEGSWISGMALFSYAAAFSLAYVSLETGVGALILFGSVQVTMIAAALLSGERLGLWQWAGSITAMGGLVYLVLPGISAPDPVGAALMGLAGASWGVYSVRGKGALSPVEMTSGNFLRAAPLALLVSVLALSTVRLQPTGVLLALLSGVVTSGLGYVLWYQALRGLTMTQASIVQLAVPVIAAFGGAVVLSEDVTLRLISASVLILGGVAVGVSKRRSKQPHTLDDISNEMSGDPRP